MTIAEKIAEQFNNDENCFEDKNGNNIEDVCREKEISISGSIDESGYGNVDGEMLRFIFEDESVITIQNGYRWDFGCKHCFGWVSVEHEEDCVLVNYYVPQDPFAADVAFPKKEFSKEMIIQWIIDEGRWPKNQWNILLKLTIYEYIEIDKKLVIKEETFEMPIEEE